MINFLKNVAIMGGLFQVAAASPAPVRVAARAETDRVPQRATDLTPGLG